MRLFRVFVIIGVGLILTLPAILHGFPQMTADAEYHAVWYTHFAEQLWAGDLYPRWLLGMNGGLGSPVFFFYPPVAYYMTSLVKPFFASDPHGWQQLGVSSSLALIASGLCAYLWLKKITNQNSAFIAAILYMALPYHLIIDLYERGAFAEFWAFVWMPLILYFVSGIASGHKLATVGLALSYALLIMTHLPTALIFSIVPISYVLFTLTTRQTTKTLWLTLGAMMLGVGLSAIYLLPALMTQEFVSMQKMRTGQYYYENWFIFAKLKLRGSFTGYLSLMVLSTVGAAGCAFIIARSGANRGIRKENQFWLVLAIVSVFMMTPLSKPVWQIIPVLQAIQFPWRFNTILTVATTALVGLGIFSITKLNTMLTTGVLLVMFLLVMSCVFAMTARTATMSTSILTPRSFERGVNIDDKSIELEYLPRWAKNVTQDLERYLQRVAEFGETRAKVIMIDGTGRVMISRWKPRDIVLQVNTPGGVSLIISQFYYPGWTAHLTGKPSHLIVQPSKPEGLLSISVPSGNHEVLLYLGRSKPELAGQIISAVFAVITLMLSVWFYIYPHRS